MRITKKQVEKICKELDEDLVKFSFLASGNHNDNYKIQTTRKKYVLRIENNPQFKNLKKEYYFLKSLKKGLGPKVYFFDKSQRIISHDYFVEEFIEGKYPKKINDKFIILMAQWLKKLHQQKKLCKKHSMLKEIKPYFRNVNNHKTAITTETANKIDSLFKRVTDFCRKNDGIFANRKRVCLSHSDLSRENIIYDGKNIRLLDWEFSRYNFPEWDIVYFMQSLELNPKQKELFIKTYNYPTSKTGKKRLIAISLLNTCGDIGYSIWRLGLVKQRKLNKKLKLEISKRLNLDINRLTKIIDDLERQTIFINNLKTIKLTSSQIITLNDYPVHSNSILSEYFIKCKLGGKVPFVPVIRKEKVRKHFDHKLLEEFEKFERQYPVAEYFMLDGSHRTTALTLAGCKITAMIYETDSDIGEAKKLVATGQILKSGTLNHSIEENCEILNKHFKEKPYFMTVEQKTKKMVREKKLPQEITCSFK